MNLFEYIKSQLPQMPNVAIMKDMGASEELIEYVKETPWNTNLGIMKNFEEDDGDTLEGLWFTATQYMNVQAYITPNNIEIEGGITDKTYNDWVNLFNMSNNYIVEVEVNETRYVLNYEEEETEKRFYIDLMDDGITIILVTITQLITDDEIDISLDKDMSEGDFPKIYVKHK